MKYQIFLFSLLITISCSDPEEIILYPDGISKPENLTESHGCGNLEVHQFLDEHSAIVVTIDANAVQLTRKLTEFRLSENNEVVSVSYLEAGASSDSIYFNFCDDIVYPNMGSKIEYQA